MDGTHYIWAPEKSVKLDAFSIVRSSSASGKNPAIKKSSSKFDVDMKIDNADFSSLILGAVDLKSLYTYGRIKISNTAYTEQLHSLFRTDQKPNCLTHF